MILDLNDIETKKKEEPKQGIPLPSSSNQLLKKDKPFSTAVGTNKVPTVIRRVLHTRQELTFYPNGQVYPSKPQSWFEDKIYAVKKKTKKKSAPLKKVIKKKMESY